MVPYTLCDIPGKFRRSTSLVHATKYLYYRACLLTYTVRSLVVRGMYRSYATNSPKPTFHNNSPGSTGLGNASRISCVMIDILPEAKVQPTPLPFSMIMSLTCMWLKWRGFKTIPLTTSMILPWTLRLTSTGKAAARTCLTPLIPITGDGEKTNGYNDAEYNPNRQAGEECEGKEIGNISDSDCDKTVPIA